MIKGRRLAGVSVAMGVGKTFIGLRDMARLLPVCSLSRAATRSFLVAALTQAILDAWPQEARKFGLVHLLDAITFTTYHLLSKVLGQGHYHKLYLDECHALKDSHEPGLKAHVARKKSIVGLTGTPLRSRTRKKYGWWPPFARCWWTTPRTKPYWPACSTTTAWFCTACR